MQKVDNVCKKILLKYLYPTDEIRQFLVNDLNEELKEILNAKILVTDENKDDNIRENNWWECVKTIGNFLIKHSEYRQFIIDNYGNREFLDNIQLVLLNYVFCYCLGIEKFKDKNIFTDKECVTCIDFDLTKIIG